VKIIRTVLFCVVLCTTVVHNVSSCYSCAQCEQLLQLYLSVQFQVFFVCFRFYVFLVLAYALFIFLDFVVPDFFVSLILATRVAGKSINVLSFMY